MVTSFIHAELFICAAAVSSRVCTTSRLLFSTENGGSPVALARTSLHRRVEINSTGFIKLQSSFDAHLAFNLADPRYVNRLLIYFVVERLKERRFIARGQNHAPVTQGPESMRGQNFESSSTFRAFKKTNKESSIRLEMSHGN